VFLTRSVSAAHGAPLLPSIALGFEMNAWRRSRFDRSRWRSGEDEVAEGEEAFLLPDLGGNGGVRQAETPTTFYRSFLFRYTHMAVDT
jgi:hypothetical protein